MPLLGGIRPPIAVLSAMLLALAGVTALSLGTVAHKALPKATLTSQQHFAEDGAVALRASLDESITDLRRVAGLFSAGKPASPDTVLDKIGRTYQKWRGTAVIEIRSGKLLAARGETVPLRAIDRKRLAQEDGLQARMIRLPNGETRLMSFALLNWPGRPQQLLVATSSLRFPGIALGDFRAIAVIDAGGKILSTDGIPEPEQVLTEAQREEVGESNRQLRAFAGVAAEKGRQHPLKADEPGSGGYRGVSGSLVGDLYHGDRSVAGYATLTSPKPGEPTTATGLGLTVVAMVKVLEGPTTGSVNAVYGLIAAGALIALGVLTVTVLLGAVQRPLLRLFLESRRLARGDLQRPVTVPRFGEPARIGGALERLRHQLRADGRTSAAGAGGAGHSGSDAGPVSAGDSGSAGEPEAVGPGRRFGVRSMLALCAVLILAWSLPMATLVNRADKTVVIPQQLIDDQRERTDTLNDRVRRALNEGHADLTSVARLIGDRTTEENMKPVLERTLFEHSRYASLYVLDAGGEILARAGEDPRHPEGEGPSRRRLLRVIEHEGKEPVVTGYAEIPGREGAAVVGEFRVDFLNSLLKRPGLGQVRIVDAERRMIGGNSGFRAFAQLPSDRLDALVAGSGQQVGMYARPGGIQYRTDDGVRLAAAAPFTGGGPAKPLSWTVVSWQPPNGLGIPAYTLQNRTILAGLLALTAAAACLGWLHIMVVRPLRTLANQAEALADGDRRTVLYPRHHDEVGAVMRSLELLRQRLHQNKRDGAGRQPAAAPAGRD